MNYAGYGIADDLIEFDRYPLIGITGRIGSGKTTAALHLCEKHGFVRHRFAGPLKGMLQSIGLTWEHTDGPLKEVPCALLGGKTPRHAMQTLGTEWGRDCIGADFWIDVWKWTRPLGFPVVVDDLRFANEAAAVAEMGGVVIKVTRPLPFLPERDPHKSEDIYFRVDYEIVNDGSREDLERAVGNIALDILSGVSD